MCVYLVLSAPPQLTLPEKYSSPVTIDRGQDIVIKIPFTGHPKPKAKWFKDGQELKTGTLIYQTIWSFIIQLCDSIILSQVIVLVAFNFTRLQCMGETAILYTGFLQNKELPSIFGPNKVSRGRGILDFHFIR